MEKYVYMTKKDMIKNIINDLLKNTDKGYFTKNELADKCVEYGLYADVNAAKKCLTGRTFLKTIRELGLYTKCEKPGRGSTARYYKDLPKEMIETDKDTGDIESLTKAVMIMMESQRSIMTTLAEIQTEMDRLYDVMKEGLSKQSKPKATSQKDTVERVKEFNFHIEVKNNVLRLIGQNASELTFEWYSMYIGQMIGYISSKEKLTENQIKTFIYTEMHNEYGYTFSVEKKRFVSNLGRQPKSGIELMYENKEFRSIFYNKIADRLAKDYGL